MSTTRISPALRNRVRRRAGDSCEYCRYPQVACYAVFHCDHYLPEARGGEPVFANLVWACPTCNASKGPRFTALDPNTGTTVSLFNPREQRWEDHFLWSRNGDRILGKTPTGRATIRALKMNRRAVIVIRAMLMELGLHPMLRR